MGGWMNEWVDNHTHKKINEVEVVMEIKTVGGKHTLALSGY